MEGKNEAAAVLTDRLDRSRIRRVLVIGPYQVGDTAMTTPVLSVLNNHIPGAEIDVLTFNNLGELLSSHPAVAHVYSVDRRKGRGFWRERLRRRLTLLRILRERRYDLLVQPGDGSWGATLTLLLRIPFAAGASASSHRLFTKKLAARMAFTHSPSRSREGRGSRHTVEGLLDFVRRLGIYPEQHEKVMKVVPREQDVISVRRILENGGLGNKSFIMLAPAASTPGKTMDSTTCSTLIDRLVMKGENVVMVCAPVERELAFMRDVAAGTRPSVLNLAGQLGVGQLAALASLAKCSVAMDSGAMHISVSVGTPVVAIFGPFDERSTGPWQVPHRVIAAPLPCRPCYRNGCGDGGIAECLAKISVHEILEAIDSLTTRPAQ